MFDGIKILDVSVELDLLLTNDRLTFGALVDGQTGVILNPVRKAYDLGLTFRIVPRKTGNGYRVEVKGSLHKFHNNGQHNADQFTLIDLLLTLNRLVMEYGIDLFNSKINCVEFGVNVVLPFPVSRVLNNLLCYKNQPFARDTNSTTPYHICKRQRYAVKVYDKGKQKGLDCHLLRFEIRVNRMEYFNGTGVRLDTLADLLNVANYGPLGALLVDTFNEILFDDPTIRPADLTPREREIYETGRNPRSWHIPDGLTPQQATAHRQQLSRTRRRYRALLDQHGGNWQGEVATLIAQTWAQLTRINDDLLTQIDHYRAVWQNRLEHRIEPDQTVKATGAACHKLTGCRDRVSQAATNITCHKLTDPSTPHLSQINPLYSGVNCDREKPGNIVSKPSQQPRQPGAVVCPVTGVVIEQPQPRQRFVSAAILRNDDDLLLTLNCQQRRYAKGSKEDEYNRAAHNVRNRDSNVRNNLARRLRRVLETPGLFPPAEVVRLTPEQRSALDYWQGTPYEVSFT